MACEGDLVARDLVAMDLVGLLLSRNLHHVVTSVLLLLDPPSLHAAKQVQLFNKRTENIGVGFMKL